MIKLKIDNVELFESEGTSVLKAAAKAGIVIPTMCFNESVPNHASCMVCAVKNNVSGEFFPSCEVKVIEGMDITTNSLELIEFRKDALELLLSDHLGDCEAPCRLSCPAFMDIPQMNRLIAQGNFCKALQVIKEEIALPLILGYICSAPCENACKRKQLEGSVSICELKKFVALDDNKKEKFHLPDIKTKTNQKVGIIGAGMSGMSAAFHLLKQGYSCTIFDQNERAGGALLQLAEDELPMDVLITEIEILKKFGAEFRFNSKVGFKQIENDFDAVVIASGANSNESDLVFNNDLFTTNKPNIFACGSQIREVKMAVKVIAQGKAAAHSVHQYLSGQLPRKQEKQFSSKFGKLNKEEITEYLKESIPGNRIEPLGGIYGFSKEEAIAEAKRCLRCDCRKSKSCKLRIHSNHYKVNQQKYKFGERKSIKKYFQTDVLVYEPEKCIKCGLCIEIVSKNKELTGLAYIGRGFDIRIDVPFNKSLQQAIAHSALECINACPTGALANFEGEDNI